MLMIFIDVFYFIKFDYFYDVISEMTQ